VTVVNALVLLGFSRHHYLPVTTFYTGASVEAVDFPAQRWRLRYHSYVDPRALAADAALFPFPAQRLQAPGNPVLVNLSQSSQLDTQGVLQISSIATTLRPSVNLAITPSQGPPVYRASCCSSASACAWLSLSHHGAPA
jgi:hypothetical protein